MSTAMSLINNDFAHIFIYSLAFGLSHETVLEPRHFTIAFDLHKQYTSSATLTWVLLIEDSKSVDLLFSNRRGTQ